MNSKTYSRYFLQIFLFDRLYHIYYRNIVTSLRKNSTLTGLKSYESLRIESNRNLTQSVFITEEKPLRILINNNPFTVTMRTPGMEKELVSGLLYSEDVVRDFSEVSIKLHEKKSIDIAKVIIPENRLKEGYMNARNFLSVSSCGVCGKTELPEVSGQLELINSVDLNFIQNAFSLLQMKQELFQRSGGCHAAAIFDLEGNLLSSAEDIGRHNAVDKVIGSQLLSKSPNSPKVLIVSGRISYEIVIKCFRAKIPNLAAVSAPSSLAIDYAKELGITLYGFCRDNRMTKFS